MLKGGVPVTTTSEVRLQTVVAARGWRGKVAEGEEEWVEDMLRRGLVVELTEGKVPLVMGSVFRIEQGEKKRWIVNLKKGLNAVSEVPRFRVVKLEEVADMVVPGDWGCVLDIRSAFNHIRIRPEDRYLFAFRAAGRIWAPTVLPFGWSGSPFWWSRVSGVVARRMRELGIRGAVYVDDILILGAVREEAEAAKVSMLKVLEELGLLVAEEKVTPVTQRVVYLGYEIDLATNTWGARRKDREGIRHLAARMLKGRWATRRMVSRLVGKIQGKRMALRDRNAMTGRLYQWLRGLKGAWGKGVVTPAWVRSELRFWASLKAHQARQRWVKDFASWRATSDASKRGWGVVLLNTATGEQAVWSGVWTASEARRHITELELVAIERGLSGMERQGLREEVVRWRSDNVAAVAAVRRLRSRSARLHEVVRRIAGVMFRTNIVVQVSHVRGQDNGQADFHSRDGLRLLADHRLRRDIFRWINWGRRHDIDAFASRTSSLLHRFWSSWPDPRAEEVDALAQRWPGSGTLWLHPPWRLLPVVLRKLKREREARVTCLAPVWPSAGWYGDFWELAGEVWILPRAPLLVHGESRRLMSATRGVSMLGFFGSMDSSWRRRRRRAIAGVSTRLRGRVHVWVRDPRREWTRQQ